MKRPHPLGFWLFAAVVMAGAVVMAWSPWGGPANTTPSDPYAPVFLDPGDGRAAAIEAISADGSTAVGGSFTPESHPPGEEVTDSIPEEHAFRWTRAAGLQPIPTPGGAPGTARAMTPDGATVVGEFFDNEVHTRAFRWTAAKGLEALAPIGNSIWGVGPRALGVSPDGQVIMGKNTDEGMFRWSQASGLVHVPASMYADAVSADASVVVGLSSTGHGWRIARWTAARGTEDLGAPPGALPGEAITLRIGGLSADGSTIVGWYEDKAREPHAFRWSRAGGFHDLPGGFAEAHGVSGDGKVVVGCLGAMRSFRRPVRWIGDGTPQVVRGAALSDACLDGVSADGTTVFGRAYRPDGKNWFVLRLR
jgi:uncharacterized membrane protein